MKKKLCLEYQLPIKGRTDKRFCDDSCRNCYNNRLNSEQNNITRNINAILRKNRRIIATILGQQRMVKRSDLLHESYNFKYHTHTLETDKGQTYIFVYNYGFLELEDDFLLLVQKS